MIRLYQFHPAFGLPNASPFCMKLETYLRMAELPYEIVPAAGPMKAPKGKMPYIEDNGKAIGDSGLIIEYLKATYGDRLDSHLTPLERATGLGLRRLMEENLYWALLYTRWIEPECWPIVKAAFFSRLPPPFKWFVPYLARRGLVKEMHGHGMGRHSRAEIYAIGNADITALADFLGDKTFFLGDRPASLDATAYAFLANILWGPGDSLLKRHAAKFPNLDAYYRRMKAKYYPDR